jgi:phospholipase/lecithinase/hemolysin/uncharacterized protein YhjY with autotransporter beta-barrel domain
VTNLSTTSPIPRGRDRSLFCSLARALLGAVLQAVALGLVSIATTPSLAADRFSSFYVFGDSSSDQGSMGASLRPTNLGPMWTEAFGASLGLRSTQALAVGLDEYGNAVAIEARPGNNFAVNGATAQPFAGVVSFSQQLDAFAAGPGRFGRDDLPMVWMTRNDITTAAAMGDTYDPELFANAFMANIGRMQSLGARNIVSFGAERDLLPLQYALDAGVPAETLAQLKQATDITERALWPRLQRAGVYVLDIDRLGNDVIANPGKYGFTHTVDSYQRRGDPSPPPSQTLPNDGNVFTLDGHYTSAMQKIVADFALAQIRARDIAASTLTQTALAFRRMNGFGALGLLDRFDQVSPGGTPTNHARSRVYGGLLGGVDTLDPLGGAGKALNSGWAGATLGIDSLVTDDLLVGIRVAGWSGESRFSSNAASFDSTSGLATVYGAYRLPYGFSLLASVSLGQSALDNIERRAFLGPAFETATGATDATFAAGSAGLAYSRAFGDWTARIGAGIGFEGTRVAAYNEGSGVLALSYGANAYGATLGSLGLRIERTAGSFRPSFEAALVHDFDGDDLKVKIGPTAAMRVDYLSSRPAQTALNLAAGFDYDLAQGTVLTAQAFSSLGWEDGARTSVGARLGLKKAF